MFGRFRKRSYKLEHLDIGDYSPAEYEGCIVELQRVNRWLGDARALRTSLIRTLEEIQLQSFSVLDVGAGSGELLRVMAEWARYARRHATLIGVELNERSAKVIAGSESSEINSVRADAFKLPFADSTVDYVICSLFTHHFRDPQVIEVLREMSRVATRRILVIDLHRHPIAYYFYRTIARLFLYNRLVREDGALSILRSFTPEELEALAQQAELTGIRVWRSFPYRVVLSAYGRAAAKSGIDTNEARQEEMRLAS